MKQAVMIALTGVALSTAAHAQPEPLYGSVTASVAVAYGDLDLSTAPGANTMLQRIKSAARSVCGEYPQLGSVLTRDEARDWRACQRRAVQEGVATLNSPAVSALYAAAHPGLVKWAHR